MKLRTKLMVAPAAVCLLFTALSIYLAERVFQMHGELRVFKSPPQLRVVDPLDSPEYPIIKDIECAIQANCSPYIGRFRNCEVVCRVSRNRK